MHGRWGVRDIEEVSLKWMFFEFYGTITQIGCTRNHREQCLHALCTCYLLGNLCCTVELFSSVCVCVCVRARAFVCMFHSYRSDSSLILLMFYIFWL